MNLVFDKIQYLESKCLVAKLSRLIRFQIDGYQYFMKKIKQLKT